MATFSVDSRRRDLWGLPLPVPAEESGSVGVDPPVPHGPLTARCEPGRGTGRTRPRPRFQVRSPRQLPPLPSARAEGHGSLEGGQSDFPPTPRVPDEPVG